MEQLTPINEQLLQIEVIDQKGIEEIRERINVGNQTLTPKQKAKILAKSIHDMIDSSLPNFSTETKRSVRLELINKKLSANSLSINANDIIESSIKFATQEELEKELSQWVHNKVEIGSGMEELSINNLLNHHNKVENEITYPTGLAGQPIIQIDENACFTNYHTLKNKLQKHRPYFLGATAIILILLSVILSIEYSIEKNIDYAKEETGELTGTAIKERTPNELPPYLQYESIDDGKLREWLNGRNSLLADEPYFSTIIEVASEFNIHPLLLFAITGQEQGFVSRDHKNAETMANNPFNVYHSWEDFNTNISESSQIAARTIVNLSKDRPEEVDPIHWINRKYAEDGNWWLGVSSIFKQLEGVVQ